MSQVLVVSVRPPVCQAQALRFLQFLKLLLRFVERPLPRLPSRLGELAEFCNKFLKHLASPPILYTRHENKWRMPIKAACGAMTHADEVEENNLLQQSAPFSRLYILMAT
jgi:hypothetical protein